MGEFDIIKVEKPKAQTEPPEDVPSIPSTGAPRPEVVFTSHSIGVEEESIVIFTPSPIPVTSPPHGFASSTRAAGKSYIEELIVDNAKSIINGSSSPEVAIEKQIERQLMEIGMFLYQSLPK